MELVFTTVAVIGGMTFSLAIAILVEELIFGKVLGVVLCSSSAHKPKSSGSASGLRADENGNLCRRAQVNVIRGRRKVRQHLVCAFENATDEPRQYRERSPEPCTVQLIIRASPHHSASRHRLPAYSSLLSWLGGSR